MSSRHSKRARATKSDRKQNRFVFEKLEDRLYLTAGNGLQAQYFNNANLSGVALVQTDASVDFDWGTGSPDVSISSDQFSVRWSGQIEPEFTESYSFIVNADDGARLWVNGQLLIDEFSSGSVVDATGTIDLIQGRKYDVQLEYREDVGEASVSLQWSSASLAEEVIPAERLFAAQRGSVLEERWNGIAGNTIADLTGNANFPDSPDSVGAFPDLQATSDDGDDFGRRIRGFIHAPTTGPYVFYVAADQSSELWISNSTDESQTELAVATQVPTEANDWEDAAKSGIVYLAAGQKYYFELLHKESSGPDHISVGWQQPGSEEVSLITGEDLSPALPTVRIYSNLPNVAEGSATPGSFTIVRDTSLPLNNPLSVNYVLSGDATNGTDYQNLSGTATIPANQTSTEILLTPLTDSDVEGDESVVVELVAGDDYQVGYQSERISYGKLQDDVDAPTGGTTLWSGTALTDFNRFGGTFTATTDPTYGDVIQAQITSTTGNPWNSQMKQNITSPVSAGDVLFVEFRIRSIGGPGEVSAIFEKSSSPFTKSLAQGMPVSADWTRIQIPFFAAEDYAIGEASFGFYLRYGAQTIQFADMQVLNYGPPRSLAPETGFSINGNGQPYGIAQLVDVVGQDFDFAYEVETHTVASPGWLLQANEQNEGVISNGDTMRFEFSIRATDGATPEAVFAVQDRSNNFQTLLWQSLNVTSDWQSFSFDLTAADDFGLKDLQAIFNLGYQLQTVEIGGFHWTNLDNNVDLEDLPTQFPASSYGGRGGTDAWRSDADDRIASERKAEVTIDVTDVNGQPLDGAVVSLRQSDHAFKFGAAINAYGSKLDPNGNETALKYQDEINRLFNTVVMENSLKWPGHLNDPARADQGVAFATSNDLYLRGHNLIWPSRKFMPDVIWDEYDTRVINDGEASANSWLDDTITARFATMLTDYDGQIPEWDVVNEPFANNDVMDLLGDDIVLQWFQQVRDHDSSIQLALNDYGIFTSNGSGTAHRDNFEYWLDKLNTADLLDVIGEQSHYNDANFTDIPVLATLVDEYYTEFNKPIAITEFDVDSRDEQLQADYLRDYMTMSFSQPAITQFLHWGFWQDSHWKPDAALYRTDFSPKPNGQAYEDLVFGNWWTDIQGTTRDGSFTTDAFQGEYAVVVEYEGVTYQATITVDDSGNSTTTVNVPETPTTHVMNRGVSYGGSDYGVAVAPDKSVLLHGETATFANYSSYVHGINELIVDVVGTSSTISADDFEFKFGNADDVDTWSTITPNLNVVVDADAGFNGSDRVVLEFDNDVITNGWLQVRMLANADTGLTEDNLFYFGSVIGDTGNSTSAAVVNLADVSLTRSNQTGFGTTDMLDAYDFNRDTVVNLADVAIARSNQSGFSTVNLITPTSGSGGGSGSFLASGNDDGQDDQGGQISDGQTQLPIILLRDLTNGNDSFLQTDERRLDEESRKRQRESSRFEFVSSSHVRIGETNSLAGRFFVRANHQVEFLEPRKVDASIQSDHQEFTPLRFKPLRLKLRGLASDV